jgi:hypothetical protein
MYEPLFVDIADHRSRSLLINASSIDDDDRHARNDAMIDDHMHARDQRIG